MSFSPFTRAIYFFQKDTCGCSRLPMPKEGCHKASAVFLMMLPLDALGNQAWEGTCFPIPWISLDTKRLNRTAHDFEKGGCPLDANHLHDPAALLVFQIKNQPHFAGGNLFFFRSLISLETKYFNTNHLQEGSCLPVQFPWKPTI